MSKNLRVLFILIFLSYGCTDLKLNVDDGIETVFAGPLTGYVIERTTNEPMEGATVTLMKNSNPGLMNYPSYYTIANVLTDSEGYFKFDYDNTQHMKFTVSYEGIFQIDGKEYKKYYETYSPLGLGEVKDRKLYLSPNALLDVIFQTQEPLADGDKFSVLIAGNGSNFSTRYAVPSSRRYVCQGNKINKLTWTIERDSTESKSYSVNLFVPVFTKVKYTLNY